MVNLVDGVIILFVVMQAIRWARDGFVTSFLSIGGYCLGMVSGILLSPVLLPLLNDPLQKLGLAIVIILLLASLGSYLGSRIATPLHILLERVRLGRLNRVVGSVFSVGATLVVVWLFAAALAGSPFLQLNKQLQQSAILRSLTDILPPAPSVLARIGSLINSNDFPRVFLGIEPRPIGPVDMPASQQLQATLAATGRSTVRIESVGCGGVAFGSGFVAGDDTIVTNAHVVAGTQTTEVRDQNGVREARIIYYDPDLDLAILSADNLAGDPLILETDAVGTGTQGAVVGYPGGGSLQITPAAVLGSQIARGQNIYGDTIVDRSIYVLQANVIQGNSGGPIVLLDGRVVGVVFATSLSERGVGYAITADELAPRLESAIRDDRTVSTGQCTM